MTSWMASGNAGLLSPIRLPASSIRSIALSGRYLRPTERSGAGAGAGGRDVHCVETKGSTRPDLKRSCGPRSRGPTYCYVFMLRATGN